MKSSYSRSFRKNQLNITQPYHKMNRKEKRAYRRFLYNNNQWDGAVVLEDMKRNGSLTIGPNV